MVGADENSVVERPQWYVMRFLNESLDPTFSQLGRVIQTENDAPFRMTAVAVYVIGVEGERDPVPVALAAAGNVFVTLRFSRPDQSFIQKRLSSAEQINPFDTSALIGAAGVTAPFYSYFSPLGVNVVYPPQSTITVDLANLGVARKVYVIFMGTKIYQPGAVWSPDRPAAYRSRAYLGYALQVDVTNIAAQPVLNVPLTIAPDADFAWQAGAQSGGGGGGSPVGGPRGLGVIVRDWGGKPYMNDFVPLELLFGYSNSQTPGFLYPEIYVPRQQQLFFDFASLL